MSAAKTQNLQKNICCSCHFCSLTCISLCRLMFVNIPNYLIVVFHCFSWFLFISAWLLSFSLGLYVAAVLFFSPENVKDGHIVLSHADKSVIYIVCLCLPERKSKHIFSEMPSCLLAGVHIINQLSVVAAAFRCHINNMVDGRDTQMCACVCVCVWLKQNTSAHTHTHTHINLCCLFFYSCFNLTGNVHI